MGGLIVYTAVYCKIERTGRWRINIFCEEHTLMAACPCGEVSGQVNIRPDGTDLF